ncbi:SSB domain-containing protein [Cephalotus follicularis]|uniref:SSB domain-containing protein n=1 Tax=Cephalotus follicularis TaxID=3775 RepID=A0A1Q3BGC6_CEPFO|nr:SSB domain-containing protein [Cephalotus follicularis]
MATLPRSLYRCLLSNPKFSHFAKPFCTDLSSHQDTGSDTDSVPYSSTPPEASTEQRAIYDRPLENGLDGGIYRAIMVGQVGQKPIQKRLRSGRTVTLFSLGTGGIRNNRRPLENEEPRDYANRSAVQWHRVSVYPEQLGILAMNNVVPGSIVYLEGNLETKIFSDPLSGLVRRIREIAIRRNGRIVFLGKGSDSQQPSSKEMRGVGYY